MPLAERRTNPARQLVELAREAVSAVDALLADAVLKGFGAVLRPGLTTSRFGWQLVAVARRPW